MLLAADSPSRVVDVVLGAVGLHHHHHRHPMFLPLLLLAQQLLTLAPAILKPDFHLSTSRAHIYDRPKPKRHTVMN